MFVVGDFIVAVVNASMEDNSQLAYGGLYHYLLGTVRRICSQSAVDKVLRTPWINLHISRRLSNLPLPSPFQYVILLSLVRLSFPLPCCMPAPSDIIRCARHPFVSVVEFLHSFSSSRHLQVLSPAFRYMLPFGAIEYARLY